MEPIEDGQIARIHLWRERAEMILDHARRASKTAQDRAVQCLRMGRTERPNKRQRRGKREAEAKVRSRAPYAA